ncbi:hypothetical protein L6270_02495 [Candidatus Parcubacteria bacterium]|nr:hypothetical protein [Patescibacteria group bacterium]MBU4309527.1 hypothetical protein [Patescibacteria group bacterium]MBU4432022.1 hypothetical protein [Patescibacteria group bacterium]MBU4577233.1 hypothetical protein [Patescibacteria group bacterium]MCG2696879.1 hypothetical protein [Candidatus Parcubacteria bacterium]
MSEAVLNNVDQMMMARNNRVDEGGRAGELRERQMTARRGVEPTAAVEAGREQSLRERVQAARAMSAKKSLNKAIKSKIKSPAMEGTSRLLRQAWYYLIPSMGFSLLWIDIHVLGSFVFGKEIFCELGEEWPIKIDSYAEWALFLALNLMAILIIVSILAFLGMIVNFMMNPLDSLVEFIKLGWSAIGALANLFFDAWN